MTGRVQRPVLSRLRGLLPALIVGSLIVAVVAVAFGLIADLLDDEECPKRFDTRAWRAAEFDSDRKLRLAQQVERCGILRNASKARVEAVLGPAERLEEQYPEEFEREWSYLVGETNDYLGPADEQNLWVSFDRDGRVRRVEVSPP
jgi:hypothetical protein